MIRIQEAVSRFPTRAIRLESATFLRTYRAQSATKHGRAHSVFDRPDKRGGQRKPKGIWCRKLDSRKKKAGGDKFSACPPPVFDGLCFRTALLTGITSRRRDRSGSLPCRLQSLPPRPPLHSTPPTQPMRPPTPPLAGPRSRPRPPSARPHPPVRPACWSD